MAARGVTPLPMAKKVARKTAPRLALGEKLVLVPFYSDATAVLHRRFFGVRGGRVERVFDMSASIGMLH